MHFVLFGAISNKSIMLFAYMRLIKHIYLLPFAKLAFHFTYLHLQRADITLYYNVLMLCWLCSLYIYDDEIPLAYAHCII